MLSLEKEVRTKTRRKNVQRIILGTIATAGLLSVAVVAPNALQALEKLGLIPSRRQQEIVSSSWKRLVAAGLLERQGKFLRLTSKGEKKLRQLELRDYKLKKPRRWDKKWRLLIFDIREERKSLRDKVRRTLVSIGFARLQDSVWVYPYDCEDFFTLLKADFKVGKDLLYIIADAIENDRSLREKFGLAA
ncbi:MAG: hypothetical protein A3C06_01450 [Candidatus Taylorbacteria bacterium RIFCSPHIGHO2_02_FULL_46_13]|uniref:Transcriptional repressor PaaX-like central Cas2-like domain-containing protein n=1 Tax=Candidatus Taylorbacteria bacterium RIFCSPHIGHO2_02_FULL_46_13 TaxID=1802312 RepID=A0A1G2MSA8_9BACT|nr:MAG: hypothetical protein A3C06_01450 [Candidatus Taylorbacteria bacterium RIFCSPHIGHO2_02_FULL_46_13]